MMQQVTIFGRETNCGEVCSGRNSSLLALIDLYTQRSTRKNKKETHKISMD
jgi:hypothetical protein